MVVTRFCLDRKSTLTPVVMETGRPVMNKSESYLIYVLANRICKCRKYRFSAIWMDSLSLNIRTRPVRWLRSIWTSDAYTHRGSIKKTGNVFLFHEAFWHFSPFSCVHSFVHHTLDVFVCVKDYLCFVTFVKLCEFLATNSKCLGQCERKHVAELKMTSNVSCKWSTKSGIGMFLKLEFSSMSIPSF